MPKTKYTTRRIEEFKIGKKTHEKIRALLKRGFSEYPEGRSYYQQVPTFRYLVYEQKQLLAHMAVDYRVINVSGEVVKIFGVGDFCVDPDFQSRHIASDLLKTVEAKANKAGIDFLVLIAKEHGLYKKNGFRLQENTCRWLMINKQQTLGIGHRNISESLMVKALGKKKWKTGLVDFLGPIF